MQLQSLSLNHVLAAPRRPESAHGAGPPLLVLLHGVGSNEQDLISFAPHLDPRFLVVSARAPRPYQYGGFSWFDIHWNASGFSIDARQAEQGWLAVRRFVREAAEAYGADPRRVYLGGFSQGAIMSLAATLTEPDLVAGLVVMSGRWMPEVGPQTDRAKIAGKPILATHGLYDNVIPISYGRAIRDFLQTLPVDLTFREYPMGHEVNWESIQDIRAWLTARLDAE